MLPHGVREATIIVHPERSLHELRRHVPSIHMQADGRGSAAHSSGPVTSTPAHLRTALTSDTALIFYVAMARLALHFWTNAFAGYGYFRDELYYLACAEHLDAGYVDQPPFSIFLLSAVRLIIGDSLFALRLTPALFSAAVVFLAGLMARQLGGGRAAQVLAALGTAISPISLAFGTVYSMNFLDVFFWTLAAYVGMLLVRTENPRYWILLGLVIGVGALNKISMVWFASGFGIGILLSPHRHWLRTRWPYLAAGIALLCFLPYVIWNVIHGFPHLEFIRNATGGKYSGLSQLTFLRDQLLIHNPAAVPLWAAGLIALLGARAVSAYRYQGIAFLVVAGILLLNGHSKSEYLAAAFPPLCAAGGVMIERWTAGRALRWLRPAYGGVLVVAGLALAPAVLPILPVEQYIRYADAVGLKPHTAERLRLGELPQFYADMFGWPEKAAAVAEVYHRLSPDEKSRCAIYAENYGRCGAIDFFGKHYGLPKSIGRHNSYWLWGPRDYTGEIMIILGGGLKDKQECFDAVEVAGTISCQYCMPYEDSLSIYICRGLRGSLADRWTSVKNYD